MDSYTKWAAATESAKLIQASVCVTGAMGTLLALETATAGTINAAVPLVVGITTTFSACGVRLANSIANLCTLATGDSINTKASDDIESTAQQIENALSLASWIDKVMASIPEISQPGLGYRAIEAARALENLKAAIKSRDANRIQNAELEYIQKSEEFIKELIQRIQKWLDNDSTKVDSGSKVILGESRVPEPRSTPRSKSVVEAT
jgi:hypothetical protein